MLDWELSTLVRRFSLSESIHSESNTLYAPQGHPYSDLANLLQPFYVPIHTDPEMAKNQMILPLRDLSPHDLPIPGAIELMQDYCRASGMKYPLEKWVACVSFAFFRVRLLFRILFLSLV